MVWADWCIWAFGPWVSCLFLIVLFGMPFFGLGHQLFGVLGFVPLDVLISSTLVVVLSPLPLHDVSFVRFLQ